MSVNPQMLVESGAQGSLYHCRFLYVHFKNQFFLNGPMVVRSCHQFLYTRFQLPKYSLAGLALNETVSKLEPSPLFSDWRCVQRSILTVPGWTSLTSDCLFLLPTFVYAFPNPNCSSMNNPVTVPLCSSVESPLCKVNLMKLRPKIFILFLFQSKICLSVPQLN